MAYVKYKELTKYFNFNREVDNESVPKYVRDYLKKNEKLIKTYKTARDIGTFTDERMILFDVNPITRSKKIHIIPYKSISSGAILYNLTSASIFLAFDSGYQLKLNFVNLNAQEKTSLRELFTYIMANNN